MRFVRPVYVTVRCDDRASEVGTGPRSRSGHLTALFTMRAEGSAVSALRVDAFGTSDHARALVSGHVLRPATLSLPDGRTIDVPAGSVLGFESPQDAPRPARLVSDSGWTDPATGAPMAWAEVSARLKSARASRASRAPAGA